MRKIILALAAGSLAVLPATASAGPPLFTGGLAKGKPGALVIHCQFFSGETGVIVLTPSDQIIVSCKPRGGSE